MLTCREALFVKQVFLYILCEFRAVEIKRRALVTFSQQAVMLRVHQSMNPAGPAERTIKKKAARLASSVCPALKNIGYSICVCLLLYALFTLPSLFLFILFTILVLQN